MNRLPIAVAAGLLTVLSVLRASDLSESDKQFLANYEQVRSALAKDDLAAARKSATELNDEGSAIAQSDTIVKARSAFAKLSDHAIKIAADQSDYWIVRCPMLNKEWVQRSTSAAIENPYAGKEMLNCGAIRTVTKTSTSEPNPKN